MAAGKYLLSRQAVTDLQGIADYLGEQNLIAADRILDELHRTFQMLAANPEIGMLCEELHREIRVFVPSRPANNYLVFYYPRPPGVMISDVLHSARDWIGLFAKGER